MRNSQHYICNYLQRLQQEICWTNWRTAKRETQYLQTAHSTQPEYEKKKQVKRHLPTWGKRIFKTFAFYKMKVNNKILREC